MNWTAKINGREIIELLNEKKPRIEGDQPIAKGKGYCFSFMSFKINFATFGSISTWSVSKFNLMRHFCMVVTPSITCSLRDVTTRNSSLKTISFIEKSRDIR